MTVLDPPEVEDLAPPEWPETDEPASACGPPEIFEVRRGGWRIWIVMALVLALLGFATWAQVDSLRTGDAR